MPFMSRRKRTCGAHTFPLKRPGAIRMRNLGEYLEDFLIGLTPKKIEVSD